MYNYEEKQHKRNITGNTKVSYARRTHNQTTEAQSWLGIM